MKDHRAPASLRSAINTLVQKGEDTAASAVAASDAAIKAAIEMINNG